MGFVKSAAGSLINAGKSAVGTAGKGLGKVGGAVFGGKDSAGVLGTGQWRPDEHQINKDLPQVREDANQLAARSNQQRIGQTMEGMGSGGLQSFSGQREVDSADRQSGFINQIQGFGTGQNLTQQGLAEQQMRGRQEGFIGSLEAQMRGEGPSLAQSQLRQATERNMDQIAGSAASARGMDAALAQRGAMQAQAQAGQQAAAQSADLRAQEQLSAQAQLGQALGTARQQDQGVLAQQAGDRALTANALTQARQGDLTRLGADNQMLGAAATMTGQQRQQDIGAAALDANQAFGLEQLGVNQNLGLQGLDFQGQKAAGEARQNLLGGGGQAIAGLAMLSDETKKDSEPLTKADAKDFIEALSAQKYTYKDPSEPGANNKTNVGVFAQDLEKSGAGADMVEETPNGKMVDFARGLEAMLATQKLMYNELKDLKKGRK